MYVQLQFPNSYMHNVCMCLISDFCIESYKRSIEARNRKTQRFSYSITNTVNMPKSHLVHTWLDHNNIIKFLQMKNSRTGDKETSSSTDLQAGHSFHQNSQSLDSMWTASTCP